MRKIFLLLSIFASCIIAMAQHALDSSFGNNGIVHTFFPPTDNYTFNLCQQVIAQQDGSFYLLINTTGYMVNQLFLTHRLADGALDPHYGKNGFSDPIGIGSAHAALLKNGKMVVGGTNSTNDDADFVFACVNANGTLDKSFGIQGKQVIDFMGRDFLSDIAISPGGKIVAVGYYNNNSGCAIASLNPDGTLDNSFSGDGKQTSPSLTGPNAIAISNTGRMIVTGSSLGKGAVAAFLPNGEPDYSFGVNSIATPDVLLTAKRAAIQSDGRIVLGAQSALFRINTDGSIDNSFSYDGMEPIDTSLMDGLEDMAIDGAGRILVTGSKRSGYGYISTVARFTSTGVLDPFFSGDGSTSIDTHVLVTYPYSLAVQGNDQVLVAGISFNGGFGAEYYASRFNNDGYPDNSLDNDGTVIDYLGIGYTEFNASVVQPDGKIICVGWGRTESYSGDFVIARFNADGSLDPSFAKNGFASVRFEPSAYNTHFYFSVAYAVALQPNGKIVVAGYNSTGYSNSVSNTDYALARLNADGSMDSSFSEDGKLITDLFGWNDVAYSVAIQPDGKIVAAGSSARPEDPYNTDFSLVRYNADGSLDNSFSWDGKQTTEFFSSTDKVSKVIIQPDGKIVAVGEAGNRSIDWSTNQDFGIARYRADGYPDNSFGYNGAIRIDFEGQSDVASDAVLLADGTFLVGGTSENHFGIVKLRANGFLDSSFADYGKKVVALGYASEQCNAIAIQSNGSILLGGARTNSSNNLKNDIAMVRLFPNGTIDSSLSFEGQAYLDLIPQEKSIESINFHQGHIYAVGSGFDITRVGFVLSAKLDCSLELSISDAFAFPVGADRNTVYKGYTPAEALNLTAEVNGKFPFTYLWSTGATTKSIRVGPNTTTTYSVTVTDASGCSQKLSKTVNVVDVRCGNKNDKVVLCEPQPGKWSKPKTVCVDPRMATMLLWKGSHLGACSSDGLSSANPSSIEEETSRFGLNASPNPSSKQFVLNIKLDEGLRAELIIYDAQGRIIERRWVNYSSTIMVGDNYAPGIYVAELKQGEHNVVIKLVKTTQ